MSVNYDIFFSSGGDRQGALATVRASEIGRRICLKDPRDLVVGDVAEATDTRRELLLECLQIDVDMKIWFKLDKLRLESALEVVAHAFVHEALPTVGDLALMGNGETTLACRLGGRLCVQRSGLTTMESAVLERALAGTPHEVTDLPNL